jgi:murein L,D-transpeptidase YcbB/YkuD
MIKIWALAAILAALLMTCSNNDDSNNNDTLSTTVSEKKVSRRDYSISKQNSFNDLFLDSLEVEGFLSKNNIADSLAQRIRSFYNTRNYQFAWFSSTGLTEQAFGFWSLKNYKGDTSVKNKSLNKIMDELLANDSLLINAHDKFAINTELLLTNNFIAFARRNFEQGYVKRKEMERFIPFKKEDPFLLADSLLNKKHKDEKYFYDINESYKKLFEQLKKYEEIAKSGSWPEISNDLSKYRKGKSNAEIKILKKFLSVTKDLPQPDSTNEYDENLQTGIKNFQKRFGYAPTGKVSPAILKEMRVPAVDRVKQILINMNRMRWMPQQPAGELIVVNIPEFILHMYNGKKKEFDMVVVVGKEGHNTTIFSNKLTTIVFRPYWNVPPDIVKKEIMPAMAHNASYLEKNDMEIVGNDNGLPAIRQKPGGKNSLGKVKFLFPNSFNIYFHDTPARDLFSKDVRAYSHGCIRLSEPQKLAEFLLKDDSRWTNEKINKAMNAGNEEKFVGLKKPVPVFITYYTAWIDENGRLNFRKDIYGHDADMAAKMFTR